MMSIIETQTLRLSNVFKSNDSMEYILFGELMKQYAGTLQTDSARIQDAANEIVTLFSKTNGAEYIPYISCFSSLEDSLGQWRGYGDDGYGVAIGFDFCYIRKRIGELSRDGRTDIYFTRVEYNDREQEKYVGRIFHALLPYYIFPDKKRNGQTGQLRLAATYASRFKLDDFEQEQEYRIVLLHNKQVDEKDLKYGHYLKNHNICQYYELSIDISKAIKKIVIGPKCKLFESGETDYDLECYLRVHNLNGIQIEKSKIPYR